MTEPSNTSDGASWPDRSPWSDGPPEPPTAPPGFAYAAPEPPTAAPLSPVGPPTSPIGPSTVTPGFAFSTPEPPTAAPGIPPQPVPPAQPAPHVGYQPGAATVVAPTSGGLPPTSAMLLGNQPPAYPVSGPGYPVSAPGYPVSGPAYPISGMGVPGVPPKPRRTAVIVLSCLLVLFVVAAGVLGGLYYTKNNAYRQQVKTVAARDTTVSDQKKQIDDLKAQLKSTQDQLTDANQKASGTQNQVNELNHEKQIISQCLDLLGQAEDAAAKGDRTNADKLAAQAAPICDEADTYLN